MAARVEHRGVVNTYNYSDAPKEKVRQRHVDSLVDVLASISRGELEKLKTQVGECLAIDHGVR